MAFSHLGDEELIQLRDRTAAQLADINVEILNRRSLGQTDQARPRSPSSEEGKRRKDGEGKASRRPRLSNSEIARFSRQLLLPEFGVRAQAALLSSSFLVVGCGGLGCPAAQYLAACGAGRLGLVDYDEVETSNLHRQVLHREDGVGTNKAESIRKAVKALNSSVAVETFRVSLDSSNALEVIRLFDVVLDCTDNVATRYLLNDACVLTGKPLVSGSALRFEGQLTVYNYKGGPTYRCLFPSPPPPETVTNCSDGGVIGAVPGVIGVLQAVESIKIATNVGEICSGKLLVFDALLCRFRTVKLRSRREHSDDIDRLIDYVQFCGAGPHDKDEPLTLLGPADRITASELGDKIGRRGESDFVLFDVRSAPEMDICSLPGSVNVTMSELATEKGLARVREKAKGRREAVFLCRRGNDSQKAVLVAREALKEVNKVVDVVGGLHAWARDVDKNFPVY